MKNLHKIILALSVTAACSACKKDTDPIFLVPPSNGAQVTMNGIAGTEAGSAAANSVYLGFSSDKTTTALRSGWDLGFYSGADFRVILNNTSSAGAKVLTKNDLLSVTAADTIGLTLATSQTNPVPGQLAYFDDASGDLTKTVIPAIAIADADNKVIIVNRGTGGSIAARSWVKLRVLRNVSGGYTLQYAGITETGFKTLQIAKNANYHFTFVSFDKGIIAVEPEKDSWDITWSYSVYQTNFGAGTVPYNFSDLIAVNYLAGVTSAEKSYVNAPTAAAAYTAFNKDSLAKTTMQTGRWAIGSRWRSTQPATGAKTDRFYIIKDTHGNFYKLKCIDMGVNDGGTRGKPKFLYSLIK